MTHLYIFAHFDDELGILPLMIQRQKSNLPQKFIYVAGYSASSAEIRKTETLTLLKHFGFDPDAVFTLKGRALDGELHKYPLEVFSELSEVVDAVGPIASITTTAWEGGHPDHDICAALTVCLGKARGVPMAQFSLYNGKNLPWRLFRGAWPLAEGGPTRRVRLGLQDWQRVLAAVRFYPSQWRTWVGLWPAMVMSFVRRGFTCQDLDPARVMQRPHSGPLLYERMFKVDYSEVRRGTDALLEAASGRLSPPPSV